MGQGEDMFGIDTGVILDLLDWIYSQEIYYLLCFPLWESHPFFHSLLGGSLQAAISENMRSGNHFEEPKLKDILLQISLGLKYIHNAGMVHLDIKPSQYAPFCPSNRI